MGNGGGLQNRVRVFCASTPSPAPKGTSRTTPTWGYYISIMDRCWCGCQLSLLEYPILPFQIVKTTKKPPEQFAFFCCLFQGVRTELSTRVNERMNEVSSQFHESSPVLEDDSKPDLAKLLSDSSSLHSSVCQSGLKETWRAYLRIFGICLCSTFCQTWVTVVFLNKISWKQTKLSHTRFHHFPNRILLPPQGPLQAHWWMIGSLSSPHLRRVSTQVSLMFLRTISHEVWPNSRGIRKKQQFFF